MIGDIATVETFSLPPDSGGSVTAFARMGYDLESALGDLIDNSIDATARDVEITFFRDDSNILAVTVADDGKGMFADDLRENMRFAAVKRSRNAGDLGAFGLGLKSASLSQCRVLTVISRKGGETTACRWLFDEIGADWKCALLDPAGANDLFSKGYAADAPDRGTVVLWEKLDRLGVVGDLNEFLWPLLARLELVLGLTFHRFIERGLINLMVNVRELDDDVAFPRKVRAHDPFGYPHSGRASYPKRFLGELPGVGEIELNAHVWPAGCIQPEFRLGRRTGTAAQGLYVYRKDRLIQAGGWNGLVKDTADAELSLARVSLDLPAAACRDVTVQKSALQVTAAFAQSIELAVHEDGTSIREYLEDARKTYRAGRRQSRQGRHVPIVPGQGFPAAPRRVISNRLAKDELSREITFEWAPLGKKQIFALDTDSDRVLLNSRYRQQIIGPVRATAVDAPTVKLLLYLLFQHDFNSERLSSKRRDWHAHCNALLYETIKSL